MSRLSKGFLTKCTLGLVAAFGLVLGGCFTAGSGDKTRYYVYVNSFIDHAIYQYAQLSNGVLVPLDSPTVATPNRVHDLAVTPDNKFLYASSTYDSNIAMYSINSDGQLKPLSPAILELDEYPWKMAILDNVLYVTDETSEAVRQFIIEEDGQLSPHPTPSVSSPGGAFQIAIHPSGNYAYVTDTTAPAYLNQYSVGPDGSLNPLSPPNVDLPSLGIDIAFSQDGQYLYVGCSSYTINQFLIGADGSLSPLTPPSVSSTGSHGTEIAISPNGKFLYSSSGNQPIILQHSIGNNGKLTPLNPETVPSGGIHPLAIDFSPRDGFLYGLNTSSNTITAYIPIDNGQLIAINSYATGRFSQSIAFAAK